MSRQHFSSDGDYTMNKDSNLEAATGSEANKEFNETEGIGNMPGWGHSGAMVNEKEGGM